MSASPTSPKPSPGSPEAPRLTLEVTRHRCSHNCSEAWMPPGVAERPFLVLVSINQAMKQECLRRTGVIPEPSHVCVNYRCGALMEALKALAPLQEIVK